MNKIIEYGKFSELSITNPFFATCYAAYYSEKNQQMYLIDFGIHRYWLGFFGMLAPLFFKFISFKAYPINDNEIQQIRENPGYKIGTFLLVAGAVIGSLIYCSTHSLYRPIEEKDKLLPKNHFLDTHDHLAVLLWLLTMLVVIFIIGFFKPIPLKDKKYKKIKIIAKLAKVSIMKKIKFLIFVIMGIFVFIYLSTDIFLYGIIFIPLSILLFLLIFNGLSSFNLKFKMYTGKIIFKDMD